MGSVVKEGYLTKRAVRGVGSNRRRWITLRENSIEWSEREGWRRVGCRRRVASWRRIAGQWRGAGQGRVAGRRRVADRGHPQEHVVTRIAN